MKRFELTLTFLQLPLDYIMIVLAGITAYYLRFTRPILDVRPVVFKLPWETYLATVLGVALLWIIIFAISGLYSTDPNRKFARDLGKIFLACSTGFAGITIYIFFSLQKFDSRFLVLASWITAIIYVTLGRLAMRGVKSLLYRAGINLRRTIIIGATPIAQSLTETLKAERRLGYLIVGTFDRFTPDNKEKIALLQPDELIITDPKAHPEEVLAAVDFANDEHIVFKYTADLFATIASNISVSTIAGIPIVEVRRTRLFGWGGVVKRLVDIVGSIILIILSSPFYLVASIAILIETGRPIIYKNERVGQHGKRFHVYKFRSMYQKDCTGDQFGTSGEKALKKEAELIKKSSIKEGPVYKIKDDPRITPLGHILRRTSIDELPQFFNVLRGEMSLVGPRPHQPREVAHYQKQHRIVLVVKPGITGLAQISGRSNLSFEEEVKLDTLYIEQWSILTDSIIILKTPFVIVKKEGVL